MLMCVMWCWRARCDTSESLIRVKLSQGLELGNLEPVMEILSYGNPMSVTPLCPIQKDLHSCPLFPSHPSHVDSEVVKETVPYVYEAAGGGREKCEETIPKRGAGNEIFETYASSTPHKCCAIHS